MFPVKDNSGKVDTAHLANALARIHQASTLTADQRATAMTKAEGAGQRSPDHDRPERHLRRRRRSGRAIPASRSWDSRPEPSTWRSSCERRATGAP